MGTIGEAVQAFREVAIRNGELWGHELGDVAKFGCTAVRPMLDLLKDVSPEVRRAAADVIDLWNSDERIVDPLIAILDYPDRGVRWEAAVRLGSTKHLRAVEPLISLLNDDDPGLRKQAVISLGRIGGQLATEAIVRALREDADSDVRASAAYQLADAAMYEPLIAAWKDGLSLPAVVMPRVFREIGGGEATLHIIGLLEHSEQRDVRAKAARVLGGIGSPNAIEALKKALDDPEWQVQIALAEALCSLGDDSGVDALMRLAQSRDHIAHIAAIHDIGKLRVPKALDALIAMLRDRDRRLYAASALGHLGDPRALEPLIRSLGEGVASAARALGNYHDSRAVDALIGALESEEYAMRLNAIHALAQIGDLRAVRPIADIAADVSRPDCIDAIQALGEIGDPSATGVLVDTLASDNAHLRQKAAWALTVIPTSQSDEALMGLLPKNDIDAISGAYTFFIEKCVPESDCALLDALACRGSRSTAECFANSGNEVLAQAGHEWLANHPRA